MTIYAQAVRHGQILTLCYLIQFSLQLQKNIFNWDICKETFNIFKYFVAANSWTAIENACAINKKKN